METTITDSAPSIRAQSHPRLLVPGLPKWEPNVERYRVQGGGAVVVAIAPGDRLTVRDPEGRQSGELVCFAADGGEGSAILGARATAEPQGLIELVRREVPGAVKIRRQLETRRLDLAKARAIPLFAPDSPPGAQISYEATDHGVVVVAAPGGPMAVDAQDPPTDLQVTIRRATVPNRVAPPLPDPLADPRLDFQVDRCTARAYEVKAGEFIQVIDVEGRECSDFQAFTAASLERGREDCLDATTTRTLMGAAYPAPGLFSKFYDQAMQPLVEVIRDTCGRHDSFGLACTAKYYEDMGYPGHVNCSDNFNGQLQPYGVEPRRGWQAINFFYNTAFDDAHQLYLDDPWSRPGDYVLLKALTDLVCVSSACPDDIDAANAWRPTDIHVRVYPAQNSFSKAVAYRMTTDADAQLTKETAFHPRTSQLTRNFTEYRGYWLPTSFTNRGAIDEYWACREAAVVMDLSPLRKFEVLGPDAETLLQWTLTRNVRRLSVGQVAYTALCYDTGGMIDDGTVFRLGNDNFRWIGGDDYGGIWMREQAEKLGLHVWVKSSTDQLHNIAVQGPKSRDILKEIVWTPPTQPALSELEWFRFAIARIGHFDGLPIIVSRTGYTGELGYEVWCHPKDALGVWDAVWEAGKPHGLSPLGLDALDMLRIESGLIFAHHEFDDQTDPFEAGIGFAVALKTKEDDFVGKEALIRRKAHPQRKLVGLELAGEEVAAHGDCVHVGRNQVGVVTSGTRSPVLRKNIALCRMAVEYAAPGTDVEVGKLDGHQKRIPAVVVPFPFYDPEKTRVRA
jgi:aminomethyltransferase